ncbi:hypothetical protein HUZ36_14065 [Pseudoalteromonas sp. McH1-7]|uniref:hypothetical protein n=1 Tax=Pseudoalteromonas TaxID=53246 RepID=UPI000FFEDE2B|nr:MULTISPECIES: hypothetical protein [Pseudoalteromonas]MDW7551294.1 hypothetical protein [Pseudoalteromonas peptidolytica]NUZ11909.1 hypothetical protein [Pseudoalteromonas sp. McH1-7]RXF04086.1 hypothetical protein D9603_06835 [Pseudoalteromonas sp. PS5]USD31096.1 hypothetical protein J8Z24_21545 [Pseudoalteromonas sp. SCSIO 43201]
MLYPNIESAISRWSASMFPTLINMFGVEVKVSRQVSVASSQPQTLNPQSAIASVYGGHTGPMSTRPNSPFEIKEFRAKIIPPSRGWVLEGTHALGSAKKVEVYAQADIKPGDKLTFERSDGKIFSYKVKQSLTLGVTQCLMNKLALLPIEAEELHD